MTFVAAKRFGKRIYIGSDTMISDPTKSRDDVIPGRLKAIILDPLTTIAYAGLSDQSIDTIKQVKKCLYGGGNLFDAEKILLAATKAYEGGLEFLIASHRDGASLKKIWDGYISSDLDQAYIGQDDLIPTFIRQEDEIPQSIVPHEYEDEFRFTRAFGSLFDGIQVSDSAGGFNIMALCFPAGHSYQPSAGVAVWGSGREDSAEEQLANRRSGMTQWGYQILPPKLRGVGVVGAIVPNAGIGYIYAPLSEDRPVKWPFPAGDEQDLTIQAAFQEQIDIVADRVGGGIEVTSSKPPSNRKPTEIELKQIAAYAAKAELPTTVTLEAESVQISCDKGTGVRTVGVDFGSLGEDPVRLLTITIDRLNAACLEQIRQLRSYKI